MKTTKTIITCIILLMGLLQGPFIYYYCSGFRAMLFLPPYMAVGFALSVYLVIKLRHKESNTPFIRVGCFVGIGLGIAALLSEDLIEYLDWKLRRGTRNEIVEQVKKGSLEGGRLSARYFPPISNGNNYLGVEKSDDKTVSVEFLINAGYLDHYSAFLYTNDPDKIKEIEERIAAGKSEGYNKLDTNWYRVNY
ncbi:hypothetical protein [Mucilaginibacter psychrotolerans]|uniref:Uncharacterized protein n=1 Tax=Mucilaginibacter psychrotolerans TaxID=1524096 RepID=A0A4Y8S8Z4_9SPHI|nr:hypothetical protein [Mucilaginibacter psychrotolerans]TFF34826.1 hypothetical protein E2R66_20805 [Mucilaginibacter psychrotolerans]